MNPTHERGHAINLAGYDPHKALFLARIVSDPWYRAQSLSFVAWCLPDHCVEIAAEAAMAAARAPNHYQQSAVRVWEIEALARCGYWSEAIASLKSSVETALQIELASSRSQSLVQLLESSHRFEFLVFQDIYYKVIAHCDPREHWRSRMNLKYAKKLKDGEIVPSDNLYLPNKEQQERILTESHFDWLLQKAEQAGAGLKWDE